MKSQSVVTDLRRKIFAEVARVAYKSESVASDIEAIPYIITPDEEPKYRENIYRERQIAAERVRLAMGLSLRPANKPVHITEGLDASNIADKYYEPPLMQVIPSACDKCPDNEYVVSDQCRNCVSHACIKACPKGAVSIVKGHAHRPVKVHKVRQMQGGVPLRCNRAPYPPLRAGVRHKVHFFRRVRQGKDR